MYTIKKWKVVFLVGCVSLGISCRSDDDLGKLHQDKNRKNILRDVSCRPVSDEQLKLVNILPPPSDDGTEERRRPLSHMWYLKKTARHSTRYFQKNRTYAVEVYRSRWWQGSVTVCPYVLEYTPTRDGYAKMILMDSNYNPIYDQPWTSVENRYPLQAVTVQPGQKLWIFYRPKTSGNMTFFHED